MTNPQLLLSIGIPSLLIVLSWITNNGRFDRIEKCLDAHDQRFNEILASGHKDSHEILRAMGAPHERVAGVAIKQDR